VGREGGDVSILPPKKSFPPFTREWLEEVAKNEPDCDITAGVLEGGNMTYEFPKTYREGDDAIETPCPKSKDGGAHCDCWYDGEQCCYCGDRAVKEAT
jgi:hypothetical protein